jgi:hypothetical protein
LKKWDELAQSIGTNRTDMIHNAVQIYELFISNQLNGNRESSIIAQLEQIKMLLKGLDQREKILHEEQDEIENSLNSIDIDDHGDFAVVADKILDLLKNWGSLSSDTISIHLNYPGWIIWTVLKKLKSRKKVKVENGEWMLFE